MLPNSPPSPTAGETPQSKKGPQRKRGLHLFSSKLREKKNTTPQTTPQTIPSFSSNNSASFKPKKTDPTPLDNPEKLTHRVEQRRQAEILPLLLRVLKALKGGSCDARRKAAERCLAELEATWRFPSLQGEDEDDEDPGLAYLGLIFLFKMYITKRDDTRIIKIL